MTRVEVIDEISHGKLTTEYRYHHGYWDGTEREFRGFGMVEHLDTEHIEPVVEEHFSPPLLTKTWFHQGGVDDDPRDRRDALRSLRGSILRTELYALDGAARQDRPYTVTEQAYGVREEAPRVFFPHPLSQRTTQWERGDEPMTQFAFTDDYDAYGQPRRKVAVAVPRHRDYRVPAPAGSPYLATVVETRYAEQRDDAEQYIVDRVAASTSVEILNDGSATVPELYRQIQSGTARRTLLGQTFTYYDGDAFVGLPFGSVGTFGAAVRSESLVLTEDILRNVYRDPGDPDASPIPIYLRPQPVASWPAEYPKEFQDAMPALAGYTFADGSDHRARGYFATTSRVAFDFQLPGLPARGLPVTTRDPFGNDTTVTHDPPFHLLPLRVTDALGLTTTAEYDYRVLQPRVVTDINGNRRAVSFSPLGFVTATAAMGKADEHAGDTLDVPGSRLEYDFFAFTNRRQPVFVRSAVREHHVTETDVPQAERDATIETITYSDGFGRVIQTRTQAEDVLFGDPSFGGGVLSVDQSSTTTDTVGRRRQPGDPPNVIVSGAQAYDNKGRVVEKYEPFFDIGFDYVPPADAQFGQKAVMFYDPRGQVVRTLNADGSEQRVIYGIPTHLNNPDEFAPTPWEAYTYDANDLAPLSHAPDGTSLANRAPANHHFTPSSVVIDALGRTIDSIARNGPNPADWLLTRSTYDVRGNVLTVTDALNRVAFHYSYDLANRPWRIDSIDAGLRRMVLNVIGSQIERRDSKGGLTLHGHDVLQRTTRLWARDDNGGATTLRQRLEYGDGGSRDQAPSVRAAMRAKNLLGHVHRHHDEAGLVTVDGIDFKGNALDTSRRVIADAPILTVFEEAPANGWQVTPFQVNWTPRSQQTLSELENELLESTSYEATSSVDALNRAKRMQLPRDVEGRRRELRPRYNRAGGLEQVWLDDILYVERIAYDAKGQRALIAYGNGVMTRYAYDRQTFRLKRLRSGRYSKRDDVEYRVNGEALQDYGYDYDLVGNIVVIRDRAPGSGVLNNPEAATTSDPALAELLASGNALNRRFTYDAIYRLRSATGRECDRPPEREPWRDEPRCTDLTKARAYTERYSYDPMGNILQLEHRNVSTADLVRRFTVEAESNRLRSLRTGEHTCAYTFDASGNMLSESDTRHFEWNHSDELKAFSTQTAGTEPSVHAHYLYDGAGQRVKKFVRKQGGHVEVTHYVNGAFDHHRWSEQSQTRENNHLHVADDGTRIAVLRVGAVHPQDKGPSVQFHLGDHLASNNVVVDADGALINREEFTPYGETSFGSFAKKRYRFTGMERDEESGLSYHGARYYAGWLGRWTSADPAGTKDGMNLYAYTRSNPANYIDQAGTDSHGSKDAAPSQAELLAECAALQEDLAVMQGQIDSLRADAFAKRLDAQKALHNLEKATARAQESASRARKFSRAARIAGGIAETLIGGSLCPTTGIGCAMAAHGVDTLVSGVRDERTLTATIATDTVCNGNTRCGDYADAVVAALLSLGANEAALINSIGAPTALIPATAEFPWVPDSLGGVKATPGILYTSKGQGGRLIAVTPDGRAVYWTSGQAGGKAPNTWYEIQGVLEKPAKSIDMDRGWIIKQTPQKPALTPVPEMRRAHVEIVGNASKPEAVNAWLRANGANINPEIFFQPRAKPKAQ